MDTKIFIKKAQKFVGARTVREFAAILGENENKVYSWMHRNSIDIENMLKILALCKEADYNYLLRDDFDEKTVLHSDECEKELIELKTRYKDLEDKFNALFWEKHNKGAATGQDKSVKIVTGPARPRRVPAKTH